MAAISRTSTFTRAIRAHRLEFLLLQNSQQLGLSFERQFGDFVQKQRAAVGVFKAADAPVGGAGECAFHVSEQFAFHQSQPRLPRN